MPSNNNDKVLFVDDEINVLNAIKRNLHSLPIIAFYASSGEEALAIVKREEIKVIVSDLQMPKMDGLTLLEIIQKEHPEIVKILLTGNLQISEIVTTKNINIFKYIIKPWNFEEEFILAINEAIHSYDK